MTVSGLRGQLQTILQCFPTNLRALNSMSASVKSVAQQLKSFDRIFVSQHENLLPTLSSRFGGYGKVGCEDG